MKNVKDCLKFRNGGITLIALVITIIVLLILAGVTIAALSGDNGILTRASESKGKTEKAQEKEGVELAVTSIRMEDMNILEISKEKLENAIRQQFGNSKDFDVIDNKDGSFLVNMNDTKRMYYVDDTGLVIAEENMLKISTPEELITFRNDVNSGNTYKGWYVYLVNDITLDINKEWEPIGLYLMENSTPADESNKPFSGIFDGNGYEINGLYINTSDKAQGLFGLVTNGIVKNIGIGENSNITGGAATAGLIGYIYNGSTISNCYNETNIVGTGNNIGGVVGAAYIDCKIINVYNTGDVKNSNSYSGGVVGLINNNVYIQNSYNTGLVNGENNVGGIVGNSIGNTFIENCYNEGVVTGKSLIAGICGYTCEGANINKCYNAENINATDMNDYGNSNVGGIVGLNYAKVTNCYNKGSIEGKFNNIGGLIGANSGLLRNSYNIGNISGTAELIGGLVGNNSETNTEQSVNKGEIYNSYSLEGISEKLYGGNSSVIGEECSLKTNSELQNLYTTLGDSFKEDKNNKNNGYPILEWQ